MRRKTIWTFISITAVLGTSMPVIAETPEDAKDYRAAVMTAMRGHIGASSMIARGLIENNGQLLGHAEGLSNAASELKNIFPEGSDVNESEALPAIWENPEGFQEAIDNFVNAAAEFESAAAGGDPEAIGAAFRQVGMGCRGCHDNFRKSDD